MKIVVCVKLVPDTAAVIKLASPSALDTAGVKFILNPYDEFAVEEALRQKEKAGGGEVVLLTLGPAAADGALRSGLAMGADRGIHVQCDAKLPEPRFVAKALAAAMKEDGLPDLILTGTRSIDAEGGQTMFRIAALLGWPVVNGISKYEPETGGAVVHREGEGGDIEVLRVPLPCVLGATRGLNVPRYPKLPDIMSAKKKPVKLLQAAALAGAVTESGVDGFELPPAKPPARILEGDVKTATAELVRILHAEAKVI
jgi:electron transfer flavoprotein beta subunit